VALNSNQVKSLQAGVHADVANFISFGDGSRPRGRSERWGSGLAQRAGDHAIPRAPKPPKLTIMRRVHISVYKEFMRS